jgi:hypothetical protein
LSRNEKNLLEDILLRWPCGYIHVIVLFYCSCGEPPLSLICLAAGLASMMPLAHLFQAQYSELGAFCHQAEFIDVVLSSQGKQRCICTWLPKESHLNNSIQTQTIINKYNISLATLSICARACFVLQICRLGILNGMETVELMDESHMREMST